MTPRIDLRQPGPSELEWAAVCDGLDTFQWPPCERVVVVSPHPDDETLGVGGLICSALERGLPIVVLAVTDGEAASTAPDLAELRTAEMAAALRFLDPQGSIRTLRLRIPDSKVSRAVDALTSSIATELDAGDLVVCPLPDDGHPDHAAVSAAATNAGRAAGAVVRWFPVWAWHCHDPRASVISRGARLALTEDALARKRRAAACHASQVEGDPPVVPVAMLVRLLRPFEVLVSPP